MEIFIEQMTNVNHSVKSLFLICGLFIIFDLATGYLKAFKYNKTNSSVSRDGYIKKMGWAISLLLGLVIDSFIGTSIFLNTTAIVIIATEGISVCENLGEIGVNIPFAKYFEKLKDVDKEEE